MHYWFIYAIELEIRSKPPHERRRVFGLTVAHSLKHWRSTALTGPIVG